MRGPKYSSTERQGIYAVALCIEREHQWIFREQTGPDRGIDAQIEVCESGEATGRLLAVPSVKYHLPRLQEPFRLGEYAFTTRALAKAWGEPPLLIEKDFSPTLAGDPLSDEKQQILRWLRGFKAPPALTCLVHGEPVAMDALKARLEKELRWSVRAPQPQEKIALNA